MTFRTLLRDGQGISGDVLQRILCGGSSINWYDMPTVPGVGTGCSAGVVGKMNYNSPSANPNHFAVVADGTTMNLVIKAGWALVLRDAGGVTFDPRLMFVESDAAITYTETAPGSTSRTDTICLRIDMSVTPDGSGTNISSIYVIQGGPSNALGNAPADGAIYLPLANVVVAVGATSLAQSNVTNKRMVHPSQARARMWQNLAQANLASNAFTSLDFDQIQYDPSGCCSSGSGAKFTVVTPGDYAVVGSCQTYESQASTCTQGGVMKNGLLVGSGSTSTVAYTGNEYGEIVPCVPGDTLQGCMFHNMTGARHTQIGQATTFGSFRHTGSF